MEFLRRDVLHLGVAVKDDSHLMPFVRIGLNFFKLWKKFSILIKLLGDSPTRQGNEFVFLGNHQPWSPVSPADLLRRTILPGERFFHGSNAIVKGPPWIPSRDTFDPLTSLTSKAAGRGSFVMEVGESLTFPYAVYIYIYTPCITWYL